MKVTDTDAVRQLPIIKNILSQLEINKEELEIPIETKKELQSYTKTSHLIPSIISVEQEKSVKKAQNGLYKLQSNLDRVVAIHFKIRDRIELGSRLETEVKME